VGSLRGPRADNQDRAAVAHIHRAGSAESLLVAVVCDGMGGMREGGYAAATAISAFLSQIAIRSEPLPALLSFAIEHANSIVHERLTGAGGTTLTAVVVLPSGAAWAVHAGDSRLYKFLPGGEPELVTQDDTIHGVVRANAEVKDEDELDNRLLQFVGIGKGFAPHVLSLDGGHDRSWFVTSDGAHAVGRKLLHNLTLNARSAGDLVRKLVFVVDAAPMGDNASVAAISRAEFDSEPTFSEGLNLSVWTPTERLELWLPVSPTSGRQPSEDAAELKSPSKSATRAGGKRKRVKNDSHAETARDSSRPRPGAPQLKISFSDPDEEKA